MTRILIVTAVAAEEDAIVTALRAVEIGAGVDVHFLIGGVGPATAAATTGYTLSTFAHAGVRPDLVLCAGIAGGLPPASVGDIVVASSVVYADLGAVTGRGFSSAESLGFGQNRYEIEPLLAKGFAAIAGGHLGAILTVSTVTGTAAGAARLRVRHPDAVAEAMEGAAIAAAAEVAGVRFAEVRAISNLVGPRKRDAWRVPEALAALGRAVTAIVGTASWMQ